MSNDKVRAEFEEWMASQGLESEWQAERNAYKHFVAHFAYQAYQASRAALVVELPPAPSMSMFVTASECDAARKTHYRCRQAIESAGIKIKE